MSYEIAPLPARDLVGGSCITQPVIPRSPHTPQNEPQAQSQSKNSFYTAFIFRDHDNSSLRVGIFLILWTCLIEGQVIIILSTNQIFRNFFLYYT